MLKKAIPYHYQYLRTGWIYNYLPSHEGVIFVDTITYDPSLFSLILIAHFVIDDDFIIY